MQGAVRHTAAILLSLLGVGCEDVFLPCTNVCGNVMNFDLTNNGICNEECAFGTDFQDCGHEDNDHVASQSGVCLTGDRSNNGKCEHVDNECPYGSDCDDCKESTHDVTVQGLCELLLPGMQAENNKCYQQFWYGHKVHGVWKGDMDGNDKVLEDEHMWEITQCCEVKEGHEREIRERLLHAESEVGCFGDFTLERVEYPKPFTSKNGTSIYQLFCDGDDLTRHLLCCVHPQPHSPPLPPVPPSPFPPPPPPPARFLGLNDLQLAMFIAGVSVAGILVVVIILGLTLTPERAASLGTVFQGLTSLVRSIRGGGSGGSAPPPVAASRQDILRALAIREPSRGTAPPSLPASRQEILRALGRAPPFP